MTCISAKSSQQLQPMDPVALGLGTGGALYPDLSDPAAVQRLQEQRQAFFQQQWQQQQAFMAAMMAKKEGEGGGGGDAKPEGTNDEEAKDGEGDAEKMSPAMVSQQQQQYYAMFMAQQSHMAQMAGQVPNPQVQMAAFMSMPPGMLSVKKEVEECEDGVAVIKDDEEQADGGEATVVEEQV